MKKQILFFLFGIFLTAANYAQGYKGEQGPSEEERTKKIVDDLSRKIKLSSSKKDSLKVVLTNFFEDMRVYGKQGDKNIVEGLEKIRDDKVKKILPVADDFNAFLKIIEDLKNRKQPMKRHEVMQNSGREKGGFEGSGY